MEHYTQTRGYATAPEAPLTGDNGSKDTIEKQREATKNSSEQRHVGKNVSVRACVRAPCGDYIPQMEQKQF